jgi:hypothetical protein
MENVQALNIDVINGTINPMPRLKDSGDDELWVNFESASHFNDTLTREHGRPVFEMMDYVKIIIPGDTTQVIHRPVRDSDKMRWPKQYAAYKIGGEQQKGYPLAEWPYVTRAQVDELAYFKIQTVEQLAHVSDVVSAKFMGLNQLRDKAKAYLEKMNDAEPNMRLAAEVAKKDEELSALRAQLETMNAAILELQETKPGGNRRSRNSEAA